MNIFQPSGNAGKRPGRKDEQQAVSRVLTAGRFAFSRSSLNVFRKNPLFSEQATASAQSQRQVTAAFAIGGVS